VGEKWVSDDCSYLCKGLRLDNIGQKEKGVEYLLLRSSISLFSLPIGVVLIDNSQLK
jgi:hypothetical protein